MIALFALVLALDAAPAAPAASPAPTAVKPVLRDAKAVLADYAKAIGDESHWKRHKSLRVKREVTIKSMQFVSEENTRIARGGKMYTESQMPGMGSFRRATDGKTAWSMDPIGGLRVLKGAEAEDVQIAAAWNSEWHLADIYDDVVSIPPPSSVPAGQAWECVELRKKKAAPTQLCFDRTTRLRVWEQGAQASQGGQVPYVTTFSDWKPVDGVLVWHHEVVTVGPVTMDGRILEIVFDEPIPATLFMLPRKK